jgi:hypothetical protein
MLCRCGGTSDQQRNLHSSALHLSRNVGHFIEARGDQSGQTDHFNAMLDSFLENLLARAHHPQIDHLVVVAAEHHAYDVFPDIVDVPFHGGH